VTEDQELGALLPEKHNRDHAWQGPVRVGWFDAPATRYAIRINGGLEALVITNVDRVAALAEARLAVGYDTPSGAAGDLPLAFSTRAAMTEWFRSCAPRYETFDGARVVDRIAAEVGAPLSAVSFGPSACDKIALRMQL
jgi:adenylosuccinate synthase